MFKPTASDRSLLPRPHAMAFCLLLLAVSLNVHADTVECTTWREPGGDELPPVEANDTAETSTAYLATEAPLVIGRITVRTGDLFDLDNSAENAFVNSAANALHLNTREATVFNALPFATGEAFSEEKLAEAERILRGKRYLRDAFVVPHQLCGNRVDVEVRTIDNWTLTPSVSFGSAGGESRYAFEIQDLNVLGLGKELRLRSSQSGDETESAFTYRDDNVLGSRYQFVLNLSDTEGDQGFAVHGGMPFYSKDTYSAWWLDAFESTKSLQSNSASQATDVPALALTSSRFDVHFARRLKQSSLPTARLGVGLRFDREQTSNTELDVVQAATSDYEETYPFLSAQWSDSRWIKRRNFQGIRNTEDIDLGLSVAVEAGLILKGLGNDDDAVRISVDLGKGWYAGDEALHKLSFQQVHYFDGADSARQQTAARYQYFRWLSDSDQLDIRLTGEMQQGYSSIDNFTVGGEDGLRAYPNRFQVGDRRVIAVGEYRHVTSWSPWNLVHTAFTGFVETGRAWSSGVDADTLANVGVGLLLSPTRSSRSAVNRFDISVPLTSNEGLNDFQIFIGTQLNF